MASLAFSLKDSQSPLIKHNMALSVISKPVEALAFDTAGIGYDHTVKKDLEGVSIFARAIHFQFLETGLHQYNEDLVGA